MTKQGFKVMDSDMHVLEPPDMWQRYIDPEFRSIAPVGLTAKIAARPVKATSLKPRRKATFIARLDSRSRRGLQRD